MKTKSMKVLALLLCIVMALSLLAGCGDNNANTNDDQNNDNPSSNQGSTDNQGTAEDEHPKNSDGSYKLVYNLDTTSGDNSQLETKYTSDTARVADRTELTYLFSDEIVNWNYLVTSSTTPAMYIDTLVEYDSYGICQPCLAESWERSDDGLVWTFHIREGMEWLTYDLKPYAPITAHDWVTSAEYILDPANGSLLADMMYILVGAEEYYTAMINEQPADFSTVGVKALDDYTLEYTLTSPAPYFLSSLTYNNFFPANKEWIEEMGDQFLTDNETRLYCGEFVMTEYDPSSVIVAVLNPVYWDIDNMHITKITQIFNAEAGSVEPEMFLRGEVDSCEVPSDQLDEWLNDPAKFDLIRPCRPSYWTYLYYFNFWPNFDEKYEPDNWKLAVNNVNFRKSIMHAFDKVSMIQIADPYNAEAHVQNTMICRDFLSADGKDYTEMGGLGEFAASDTYNVELANEYKAKAIEELTAAGAHFPVIVYVPYDTEWTADTRRVQLLEQFLERNLGTDYIDVVLEGYPDDNYTENVLRSGNYCLNYNSWYPDYQDPLTNTDPFTSFGSNRRNWIFMADGMSKVSDTYVEGSIEAKDGKYYYDIVYDQMIDAAAAEVVDIAKRYEMFAEAENWLVNEQCMVIPYMRGGTGYMGSTLMPFESQYAAFGASDGRYKYQYIYTDGLNTDEYYAGLEIWEAERAEALAALEAAGKIQGVDY